MEQVDLDIARRAHTRKTFADCAVRYLAQSQDMRSIEAIRVHVRLLVKHIGHLEPQQVHDVTLAPFISTRIADGTSATTINARASRRAAHAACLGLHRLCGGRDRDAAADPDGVMAWLHQAGRRSRCSSVVRGFRSRPHFDN
jgi:hypothetical protein